MSKKARFTYLIMAWLLGFGGCSTTETTPKPIPTVSPPEYVHVPHPAGFDMVDVSAIFTTPEAPAQEKLSACETDFQKLRQATLLPRNDDDFKDGVAELVKQDPVLYHWCFYNKIVELEKSLRAEAFIEEKQKKVLAAYSYMVPVARGFMKNYRDSRYLRWAIRHYRQLSRWVFFQKLEQTPKMTGELVEVNNPFGVWREPADADQKGTILQKYHLGRIKTADPNAPSQSLFQTPPADAPAAATDTPAPAAAAPVPAVPAPAEAIPAITPEAPPAADSQ